MSSLMRDPLVQECARFLIERRKGEKKDLYPAVRAALEELAKGQSTRVLRDLHLLREIARRSKGMVQRKAEWATRVLIEGLANLPQEEIEETLKLHSDRSEIMLDRICPDLLMVWKLMRERSPGTLCGADDSVFRILIRRLTYLVQLQSVAVHPDYGVSYLAFQAMRLVHELPEDAPYRLAAETLRNEVVREFIKEIEKETSDA